MIKISITNHTGSRNRGAEALVRTLAIEIRKMLPDVKLFLHSNDFNFDEYTLGSLFDKYVFSYLTRTPNHLRYMSINKIFYKLAYSLEKILKKDFLSTLSLLKESDITIITGGDILTSDYKNFRKHASYLLNAKNIYICAQTIGPFNREDEKYFINSLKNISYITAREIETFEYLKELNLDLPIEHTADVAFLLPTLDVSEYKKLKNLINFPFEDKTFVTLSISRGIIKYSNLNKHEYFTKLKELLKLFIKKNINVVIVPHVQEINPSNNDLLLSQELAREINSKKVFVVGHNLNSIEFKTIISNSIGHIGTRTHTTIAAYSSNVPTIAVAYSRKAYGIAKDIYGEKYRDFLYDVKEFNPWELYEKLEQAICIGFPIKKISEIKKRAKRNFEIINELV